nr:retrovirus-related Pol polyprotein from transposon TNT 1-94 [Tanacetum cinerariifolium]
MRPFGCPVTILNTLDPLGKFDGKADEGFLVGYSVSRKAFRVFNSRTQIVQETLHINFLENKPNVAGSGEDNVQQYVFFPLWSSGSKDPQNTDGDATFKVKEPEFEVEKPKSEVHVSLSSKFEDFLDNSINEVNVAGTSVPTVGPTHGKSSYMDPSQYPDDPNMPALEDITYSDDKEDVGAEADFTNLETNITDEGIDYEEVFAPVAMIEAIRLFLAYASFMGFMVYQMNVKSAFLYGTIKEE